MAMLWIVQLRAFLHCQMNNVMQIGLNDVFNIALSVTLSPHIHFTVSRLYFLSWLFANFLMLICTAGMRTSWLCTYDSVTYTTVNINMYRITLVLYTYITLCTQLPFSLWSICHLCSLPLQFTFVILLQVEISTADLILYLRMLNSGLWRKTMKHLALLHDSIIEGSDWYRWWKKCTYTQTHTHTFTPTHTHTHKRASTVI